MNKIVNTIVDFLNTVNLDFHSMVKKLVLMKENMDAIKSEGRLGVGEILELKRELTSLTHQAHPF